MSTMNDTDVPKPTHVVAGEDIAAAQTRLSGALPGLTREQRKAAIWLLENPQDVGFASVRALADQAGVKPNTLVRMARAAGYQGFEDFRAPYRAPRPDTFPDRARWLQALARGGQEAQLIGDMAAATMANTEALYAAMDPAALKAAAQIITAARRVYVLGVGVANPAAQHFAYLAGMALDTVTAIPQAGTLPADDLARAGPDDVLIAMTFRPYRREVIEAVETAHTQHVPVIGLSDSLAAPILTHAAHRFIVPTDSPQAFTSTAALTAFLETLIAMVIAEAGNAVLRNIERFHARRHSLGIYWEEPRE